MKQICSALYVQAISAAILQNDIRPTSRTHLIRCSSAYRRAISSFMRRRSSSARAAAACSSCCCSRCKRNCCS